MSKKTLVVYHFPTPISYQEAWEIQKKLVEKRKLNEIPDSLLLLEHQKVITLGRDGSRESLLFDEDFLREKGVALVQSDRGGDATYHGPGQLVAYPILSLKDELEDIPKFVRLLEQTMLDTIGEYGLFGGRIEGTPGTWLFQPDRKIGAVGARISRWVTHHGIALNVNTELSDFQLIIPCGLSDKGVTSLEKELGKKLDFNEVKDHFIKHFSRNFNRSIQIDFPSQLQ
jgi:lipoyl(octanoyl) transferase